MLGHYGWILVKEAIDHPEAAMHGGRVYLSASEISRCSRLKEGDRVQFFLYADGQGLGAEDCRLAPGGAAPPPGFKAPPPPKAESTTSFPPLGVATKVKKDEGPRLTPKPGGLRASAAEFTPAPEPGPLALKPGGLRADAAEFTPAPASGGLRVEAAEFTPSQAPSLRPEAPVFKPSVALRGGAPGAATAAGLGTVNPSFFACDSDSDEEDEADVTVSTSADLGGSFHVAMDSESDGGESGALGDGSDAETDSGDELCEPAAVATLAEVAPQAVLPFDVVKAPLCDGVSSAAASTRGGDSGSDTDCGSVDSEQLTKRRPPGLPPPSVRPPPGLKQRYPCLQAPPGLKGKRW